MNPSGVPRDDRANILGLGVSSINLDDAVATIVSERSQNYVCVASVHGVMEGGTSGSADDFHSGTTVRVRPHHSHW